MSKFSEIPVQTFYFFQYIKIKLESIRVYFTIPVFYDLRHTKICCVRIVSLFVCTILRLKFDNTKSSALSIDELFNSIIISWHDSILPRRPHFALI